MNALELADT